MLNETLEKRNLLPIVFYKTKALSKFDLLQVDVLMIPVINLFKPLWIFVVIFYSIDWMFSNFLLKLKKFNINEPSSKFDEPQN